MRAFVEGFNQSVLLQLKLDVNDALILQWFKSFNQSSHQKYLDRGNERFYWVKYSKVIEDLPCLYITNPKIIGKIFSRLSGEGSNYPENFPLKKVRANIQGVQEVYFRFREEVLERLEGKEVNGAELIDEDDEKKKGVNDKLKRKHQLNPNVMDILDSIRDMKLSNGKSLFCFSFPQDSYHYTKSIEKFQSKILSIYTHRFFSEYRMDSDFILRNDYYEPKRAKERIKNIDSWKDLKELILKAAERYQEWFQSYNEPINKKWLTRDVSSWIYNEHSMNSIFLLCCEKSPSRLREVYAENVFNLIPEDIRKSVYGCLKDRMDFDGLIFWSRIYGIVQWYEKVQKSSLIQDPGYRYWTDGGLIVWFQSYLAWLMEFTHGCPVINNFGVGNATWRTWINIAVENHKIEAKIPFSL